MEQIVKWNEWVMRITFIVIIGGFVWEAMALSGKTIGW